MAEPQTARSTTQYRVGCAGQFLLGQDVGYEDLDEALSAAGELAGSFVYGPGGETDQCYGPYSMAEIHDARARLAARRG